MWTSARAHWPFNGNIQNKSEYFSHLFCGSLAAPLSLSLFEYVCRRTFLLRQMRRRSVRSIVVMVDDMRWLPANRRRNFLLRTKNQNVNRLRCKYESWTGGNCGLCVFALCKRMLAPPPPQARTFHKNFENHKTHLAHHRIERLTIYRISTAHRFQSHFNCNKSFTIPVDDSLSIVLRSTLAYRESVRNNNNIQCACMHCWRCSSWWCSEMIIIMIK